MGFFAEFWTWLDVILLNYIQDSTQAVAAAIEPAVVTLGVLYIIVWGYLHLMGQIEEAFLTGLKRLVLLAVILGVSLSLWYYNEIIVDTFFNAPSQLAAAIIGAYAPVGIVDEIAFRGDDVAAALNARGGVLEGFSFYIAAGVVHVLVGFTAVYTIFLLSLSRIALSILLALGPLFIALLFFETTKRFFESWIAQLANYAFISILTILAAALMLSMLAATAQEAASRAGEIQIADAVRVCLAAGLTVLVMRQVMPIAAGLASGLALSSFGVVSAAMAWGLGGLKRTGTQFSRGLLDKDTTRWDPMGRKAGHYTRRAGRALWNAARANTLRAR